MNKKINLEISNYPQALKQFSKENLNLKTLCAVLIVLTLVMGISMAVMMQKGPSVVALDAIGQVTKVETKVSDLQIESAAKEYLSYRYSWDEKTVIEQLKNAEHFVLPSLVSSFQKSMKETIKFVQDKKVKQRVYSKTVDVNLKEKKIKILADRITEFDGLKAATELRLTLQFDTDSRTVINPWGIYVTKEIEESIR